MGLTLELCRIDKAYNGKHILKDCSYTFQSGRTYILMSPNGSGKSTLFRIAALLEAPDQGEVKFFSGKELLPRNLDLKRRITMVFPRVGLFNISVFHNVAYGLKIRGVGRKLIDERVAEILDLVGLMDKQRQSALTLSSGEAMRLGLARALVIDPEVIFLDEPTTSLDLANTAIIEDCLVKITRDRDVTLILVTHDAAQAERIGGRCLTLAGGRIVEL